MSTKYLRTGRVNTTPLSSCLFHSEKNNVIFEILLYFRYEKTIDLAPDHVYRHMYWDVYPKASASQIHSHIHSTVANGNYYCKLLLFSNFLQKRSRTENVPLVLLIVYFLRLHKKYAIPKIKTLHNLSCLETRFKMLYR